MSEYSEYMIPAESRATFGQWAQVSISKTSQQHVVSITYPSGTVSKIYVTSNDIIQPDSMALILLRLLENNKLSITSPHDLPGVIKKTIKREKVHHVRDDAAMKMRKKNIAILNTFLKCVSKEDSRLSSKSRFIFDIRNIAGQSVQKHIKPTSRF